MPVIPLKTQIGKYRIEMLVGVGGMGEVYRATNLQTRTSVAIKALTNQQESPTALARFKNEAIIQYNLRHPNVAVLHEYLEYQGRPCIVMEFVEGQTLSTLIRQSGGIDSIRALEILAGICDAVSYMHAKGIIHRDIKSDNIRISPEGDAKLLDFGIAVSLNTPPLTNTGKVIGTLPNMAPEQVRGLKGDARSDVWALGVLLYEMVTGEHPFDQAEQNQVARNILAGRFVPAAQRKPHLSKRIDRIIGICLRIRPEERFASAGVLLREMQQYKRRATTGLLARLPTSETWLAWGIGALLVGVLGLLIAGHGSTSRDLTEPPPREPMPPILPAPQQQQLTVSPYNPPAPRIEEEGPALSVPAPSPPPRIVESPVASPVSGEPPLPKPTGGGAPPTVNSTDRPENLYPVRIETYDGPAEVLVEGKPAGYTPVTWKGPSGKRYNVRLKRDGYNPLDVQIQIGSKPVYSFGLEITEKD